jgi:hypothetical protein
MRHNKDSTLPVESVLENPPLQKESAGTNNNQA